MKINVVQNEFHCDKKINKIVVAFIFVSTLVFLFTARLFAQESIPTTPQQPSLPTSQQPGIPSGQFPQQLPGVPSGQSPQQLKEYYRQAKEAGMSDSEIRKAAEQRGIKVDELLRENDATQNESTQALDPSRNQNGAEEVVRSFWEDAAPDSTFAGTSASGLKTFGSNFFSDKSISFEPNLRIATPKNYILGPDDELILDINGRSADNQRLKVSPEGTIKLYNLAPLTVSGLTVEQASERIIYRLRQSVYSGLNVPGSGTNALITLGNIRSIKVMVTGEVVRPGTYTVSSLATAFNALISSGGPNSNGSFRNIQLIRNNNVLKKIDLYRFLVDGDLSDNLALQDQDIIIVRPYTSKIELRGEAKRPGIFELREGETFKDLIWYAGGYTPEAFTHYFTYRRNNGVSYELGSFLSNEVDTFVPINGDQITVGRIVESIDNFVNVVGAVVRPGTYPFEEKNNTVKKVLRSSLGLTSDAFLGRANILRVFEQKRRLISFDLSKLISDDTTDIRLVPGDALIIKSTDALKQSASVSIHGAVNRRGTFDFYEDISISDLIFNAGGFTRAGIPYRVEVSRRIKDDTLGVPGSQNVKIFNIEVSEDLVFNTRDEQFKLQPFDKVFVRTSPRYEEQKTVSILGEIYYPGQYTILNNFERISDIIPKAGGLKPAAYLEGSKFVRRGELVALNLSKILNDPADPSNILLNDGDQLTIPTKSDVIRIQGGVLNPSVINYQPSFKFADYLSQAGGYSEDARKRKAYVVYPNGRTKLISKSAKIMPGSVITIPEKDPMKEEKMSRAERIAILSMLVTASLTLIRFIPN
jgi:polysaccharide export outer membrane protein